MLAGAIATCSNWNFEYGAILAGYITRKATYKTYTKLKRCMMVTDILASLN
jgi:hypothetical protein